FPAHYFRTAAIDGGVWANNPTGLAVVEAISMLGQTAEIRVLSLGCTENPAEYLPRLFPFGFWARQAFDASVLGQSFASLGIAKLFGIKTLISKPYSLKILRA